MPWPLFLRMKVITLLRSGIMTLMRAKVCCSCVCASGNQGGNLLYLQIPVLQYSFILIGIFTRSCSMICYVTLQIFLLYSVVKENSKIFLSSENVAFSVEVERPVKRKVDASAFKRYGVSKVLLQSFVI